MSALDQEAVSYQHSLSKDEGNYRRPNVVFCNLQNSGASAIDPILRRILKAAGYLQTKYGPEGTDRLKNDISIGVVQQPFYHWTHHPPSAFEGMIGESNYRFLYLLRDPRDAAVSWAYDFQQGDLFNGASFHHILKTVLTNDQHPHVRAAVEWVQTDCHVIRFDQVRQDINQVFEDIIGYIGRHMIEAHIDQTAIQSLIDEYSFEKVTGRRRGSDGETVRSGYMLRKGISGEWRSHFDEEHLSLYRQLLEKEIETLGYSWNDTKDHAISNPIGQR